MRLKAYGKINLTLEVLDTLPNGYHQLRSVMQSISAHDILEIETTDDSIISITCDDKTVPTDESNTVYKAARLYLDKVNSKSGLKIHIEKHLPHQAGLGAASADAAAVLRYLYDENEMSFEELLKIAEKVGADVPFCLVGGTKLAEGIGEELTQVNNMPNCKIVVVKPLVGASTPSIFKNYDSMKIKPKNPDSSKLISALEIGDLKLVCKELGNALELSTGLKEIEGIKRFLVSSGAIASCMTGSGSAVFGIFDERKDVSNILKKAENLKYISFECKPIF